MDYAIVIPARFESTRLPGKPLIDLCGVPIVVRTYRQCAKACPADRIHVATDDERVAAVCRSNGIQVIETPGGLPHRDRQGGRLPRITRRRRVGERPGR